MRVPVYEQQVGPSKLPQPNVAAPASADALGASIGEGIAKLGQSIAGTVGGIAEEEKKKADRLRVFDAENQFDSVLTDAKWNKDSGFLNKKEKDAIDSAPYKQRILEAQTKIASTLQNDDQRELFQMRAGAKTQSTLEDFARHTGQQIDSLYSTTKDAAVDTALKNISDNFNRPVEVQKQIDLAQAPLQLWADHQGLPTEARDLVSKDFVSKAHGSVVRSYLGQQDGEGAMAYVEQHRAELGPDAHTLERQAMMMGLAVKADRAAQQIYAGAVDPDTGKPDVQKAQAAWEAMPAGHLKDQAREELAHRISTGMEGWNKKKDDVFNASFSEWLAGHSMASISKPNATWLKTYDPVKYHQLEEQSLSWNRQREGEPPSPSQQDAYTELILKVANNPHAYDGWDAGRFRSEYGPRLALRDYEPAMKVVADYLKKPDAELPAKQVYDYLHSALEAAKVIPAPGPGKSKDPATWSPEQRASYYRATTDVREWLQGWQAQHPKELVPPDAEFQKFIDKKMLKGREPGTGWFGTSVGEKSLTQIQAEATGKPFVPDSERPQIEDALKQSGISPTPEAVLNMYKHGQTSDTVMVVPPGGTKPVPVHKSKLGTALKAGGKLVAQ